jgi:hypothetical protein
MAGAIAEAAFAHACWGFAHCMTVSFFAPAPRAGHAERCKHRGPATGFAGNLALSSIKHRFGKALDF